MRTPKMYLSVAGADVVRRRLGIPMAGVQSAPRVMRGPPVVRPMTWDVPLEMRTFELGDVSSPTLVQVPTSTQTTERTATVPTPLIVGGLAVAALCLVRGKR